MEISPGLPPAAALRALQRAAASMPANGDSTFEVEITGHRAVLIPPRATPQTPQCEVPAHAEEHDGVTRLLLGPVRMARGYWIFETAMLAFSAALCARVVVILQTTPLALTMAFLFLGFMLATMYVIRYAARTDANRRVRQLVAEAFPGGVAGLLALAVMLSGCSRPSSDVPEIVQEALLAQASGPGGCRELGQVIATTSEFFPGVRFFEAPCVREHGDTVVVNAAIDGDGTPFLLNSRSEFSFLLSQHRPVGIDSSNVVDYGLMTLFLTGEITGWAELVRDADSVPEAQLATAGFKRGELPGSGVQDFPHGVRIVWVTVSAGGNFLTYGMTLDTVSGEMVIVQRPGDR